MSEDTSAKLSGVVLLSRYKLENLLGSGGTSDVYCAFDHTLERKVAVKVLSTRLQADEDWRQRFLREARVTSQFSHPNLMSIFDYGVHDETQPFIVTELLRGGSLNEYLDDKVDLTIEVALSIFLQIAQGLAAAHEVGMAHRDLKPSNVMLVQPDGTDLQVKVIDFGLLKPNLSGDTVQQITADGAIFGTVHYLSPEVCLGKQADRRSDIYALGCVMYECLTGLAPFRGDNVLETLQMHISSQHQTVNDLRPDLTIPGPLVTLIDRCLKKNPDDRPQTMGEVVESLQKIQAGNAGNELNPKAAASQTSGLKREYLTATVGIAALGTVIFFTLFALKGSFEHRNSSADTKSQVDSQPEAKSETTAAASSRNAESKDTGEEKQSGEEVDRLTSMATACHKRGECDTAVSLLERAVKLSSKVYGPDAKQTKERKKDLAVMYMTLGEQSKANKVMSELSE